MTLQVPTTKPATDTIPEVLFRHPMRTEWGLGILVRRGENRRAYLFEDGAIHKIKKGYYDLLEEVEDFKGAQAVFDGLVEAFKTDSSASNTTTSSVPEPAARFADQVALFRDLYPQGFEDPSWIKDHRGKAGESGLKRHREPTLSAARAVFSSNSGSDGFFEGLLEVLAGTNLVPISHVKTLQRLNADERSEYEASVRQLTSFDGAYQEPLREHLFTLRRLLGKRPSWRVGTAVIALAHPQEHVCVRSSAFLRQAASISPGAKYTRRPRTSSYEAYRRMAHTVRDRLREADLEPRDLLDVYDFIWTTLRKSALEHLAPS